MIKKDLIKDENGSVVVLTALAIIVIMGFCGFAVDFGRAYLQKQKFQTAVDAASVAAAWDLPNTTTATATAKQYMVLNGFAETDIADPTYSPDSMTINISGTKNINYTLAKAVGFTSAPVHSDARATKTEVDADAFGYTVFAGEGEVTVNGGMHTVNGDVYGNKGIIFNGNNNTITGNAVCTTGTISVDTILGDTIEGHAKIGMPDYLSLIKDQGLKFNNQAEFEAYLTTHTVSGPIFINGTLNIHSRIMGTGIIYASGGITYDSFAQTSADSICFYSGGDIKFNGNHGPGTNDIYGILYAPNGVITVDGGKGDVHGRIIGKTITDNGAKYDVITDASDEDGIHTLKTVKLIN
ncbi:MAG: TadE/TadG family type IV pilus assembly protein [Solirubrobacterales bacterium]